MAIDGVEVEGVVDEFEFGYIMILSRGQHVMKLGPVQRME